MSLQSTKLTRAFFISPIFLENFAFLEGDSITRNVVPNILLNKNSLGSIQTSSYEKREILRSFKKPPAPILLHENIEQQKKRRSLFIKSKNMIAFLAMFC